MPKIKLKQIEGLENFEPGATGLGGGGDGAAVLYAYDLVGTTKYQLSKFAFGPQGVVEGIVSSAAPLPVAHTPATQSVITEILPADNNSFTVMAVDSLRVGATVVNRTDAALKLSFGGTASATTYSTIVPAGSTLILNKDDFSGLITGYCQGVGKIVVTQFKRQVSTQSIQGVSFKTVNNQSITGTGNIQINPVTDSGQITITVSGLNSANVQDAIAELRALLLQETDSTIKSVNGKLPVAYVPDSLLSNMHYIGAFDPNVALPTATEQNKGGIYIANADGGDYKVGDWAVSNGTSWDKIDNTDAVINVAGKTGAVLLDAADITSGVFSPLRIPNLDWSKIVNLPTTVEGFGISNAAIKGSTLEWYGITNAVAKTIINGVPGCATDTMGNVRALPVKNNSTAGYNFIAADNGITIVTTAAITVPANVMAKGDIVMLYNDTSTPLTITTSAVTAYISGIDAVITSFTLATRGMCSVFYYDVNKVSVSGDVY